MLTKSTEKDRTLILNYCMAEPNMNLFIIGDIENFGFDSDFQDVWVQTSEDKIVGVVLRYHDNFIIYSKDMDMDTDEVIELLNAQSVKIVSGKLEAINQIYPQLEEKFTRREMYFCELKDSSKLRADIPANAPKVITAEVDDAMEIAKVYDQIDEFEGLYSSDIDNRCWQIESRIRSKEGVHMFIKEGEKIICHGNTTAETSTSGMIGGILTLPEYRNQGLASQIVASLCRSLFSRGKSACLFYDNPEAGNIYHRVGFEIIGKWAVLGRKAN